MIPLQRIAMAHGAFLPFVLLGFVLGAAGQAELIGEAAPKLQLAVDAAAATAFVSRFGAATPMSAVQIGMANDKQYIPLGHGPEYNVPEDVISAMGYKPWTQKMKSCKYYGCPQPAPNPAPYYPTIFEWASSIPDQSISVQIMDIIGADVFKGPFTGTLFLPTNAAWAAYLARWRVPIVPDNTRAQEFYANFFIRLLQYHTLLLRVYGAQMDGFQYSTVYANINNYPHKVTYGTNSCNGGSCGGGCNGCSSTCSNGCNNPAIPPCSTCDAWYGNGGWEWKHGKKSYHFWSPAPSRKKHFVSFYECSAPCSGSGCANQPSGCSGSGCSGSGCSGSGCSGGCNGGGCGGGCNGGGCGGGCNGGGCGGGCSSGGCGCAPANFLIDEQKNVVTFDQIDKFVYGGGVIHTINQVLEPNDIFPSLTAAINSSAVFSDLRIAFDRIENEGNFSLLPQLEEIPGTIAAPVNEAFTAAGVNVNTASVEELQNIIAYHFCAFTRAYRLLYYPFNGRPGKNPCLTILSRAFLLDYGLSWKHINNGATKPPEMWINYAGGVYPNGLTVRRSNILIADLTMPVHTGAVVADLIMPPSNLGGRVMATSKRNPVRLQLTSLIESGGMTNAWKEGRSNAKRRAARNSRTQAVRSSAPDKEQFDAEDDDDQVRRMRSLDSLNARPAGNGRRLFSWPVGWW